MNIFVGNLAFDATQDDIKKLFEGFGNVTSAVIVMSKEKKAPKSRGFGFVEMPDEEQALAAIAALNEKEFMGRILNISQARPKTEADRQSELKMKMQLRALAKSELLFRKEKEQQKALADQHLALKDRRVRPSGQRLALKVPRPNGRAATPPSAVDGREPGTYRGGRRTRSYMKKHGLAGMPSERGSQENPMRWRKRRDKPEPWQKSSGEQKPWQKSSNEQKPWKKSQGSRFKGKKKPAGRER